MPFGRRIGRDAAPRSQEPVPGPRQVALHKPQVCSLKVELGQPKWRHAAKTRPALVKESLGLVHFSSFGVKHGQRPECFEAAALLNGGAIDHERFFVTTYRQENRSALCI